MHDDFFEEFGAIQTFCDHQRNDGVSCHDCLRILTHYSGATFTESSNYFPRKQSGSSIRDSDLVNLNIPHPVLACAHELFAIVTRVKIFRGTTRLGVIAACLLHGYKLTKVYVAYKDIIAGLKTTNKKCLKGLQILDMTLFEHERAKYDEVSKNNLTVEEATATLADLLGIKNFIIPELGKIGNCRINSAAAVAVWTFVQKYNLDVTLEQIVAKADVSLTTIKKIIAGSTCVC